MDIFFVIFLCKRCLLGQTKRRGTLIAILRPPDIPTTPPTPLPPLLLYFTQIFNTLAYQNHPIIRDPRVCVFKRNQMFGTKCSKINRLQKTIEYKKKWKEYQILKLKYGNWKLQDVCKYNRVRLVLAVFVSVCLK